MNTHKILSTAISKSLPKPLAYLQTQIADSIQALVQYSPTIGLMGKTGAGKSSLINALFQSNVSTVNHVERGTTQAIPLRMALRKRTLTFTQLKSPYRTETVKQQVQQDFSHCVNTTIDTLIHQLPLPIDLKTAFIRVKNYLVSAVVSLWRWLF
ncbi:GTPase [Providencia stuartii]|uniref:GTPase n=1 Tax=Providencia stuartii TaxID=588 RepID=UPI00146DFA3E|nr:GTPase [Providencia stuartii]NMT49422.1 ATP-binding cassette domain-containing protein [Providencia stuartii]